jgi:hypothetical protein
MAQYVALIDGEAGVYRVTVPDLPGCTSGGSTTDEALRHEPLGPDNALFLLLCRTKTMSKLACAPTARLSDPARLGMS